MVLAQTETEETALQLIIQQQKAEMEGWELADPDAELLPLPVLAGMVL